MGGPFLHPDHAVHLRTGGQMTLAVGKWETLERRHGTFGGYDVRGDWVSDTQLKRGWLIHLDGLDSGSFAVCNAVKASAGLFKW